MLCNITWLCFIVLIIIINNFMHRVVDVPTLNDPRKLISSILCAGNT